jgi:hypothetical protein
MKQVLYIDVVVFANFGSILFDCLVSQKKKNVSLQFFGHWVAKGLRVWYYIYCNGGL